MEKEQVKLLLSKLKQPAVLLSLSGDILHFNTYMLKACFIKPSAISGSNFLSLFSTDFNPMLKPGDLYDEAVLKVSRHHDKNANSSTLVWSGSLIESDSEKLIYLTGTLISSIEKEKVIYQTIIDQLPAQVFWKDKNLVYSGCNDAFVKSLRLSSKKQIIGMTDFDLPVDKKDSKAYREDDLKVIKSKKPKLSIEEKQTLFDGSERILSTNKVPLLDTSGEILGVLGIYIDITDLRQAQARRLTAEKNELAARAKADSEERTRKTVMVLVGDIVHDLRTPIATIRTATELLSSLLSSCDEILDEAESIGVKKLDLLSPKERQSIKTQSIVGGLRKAVITMDDFINTTLIELKNAQKPPERLLERDFVLCSSRRIIENALEAYPFEPHIRLNQSVDYDFDLRGNSILVMKILFNLIENAVHQINVKHTGEIYLSTGNDGAFNYIQVRDTAGGIAKEVVKHLFEPYFSTKPTGTGIGLSFCKQMMETFNGELRVFNQVGEGAAFLLCFPVVR